MPPCTSSRASACPSARRRPVGYALAGLLLIAILPASSSPAAGQTMPDWYAELGRIRGVNLPNLGPGDGLTAAFVNDPTFVANVTGMGWNTLRVPVKWQYYVDSFGNVDEAAIADRVAVLEQLIARLAPSARQRGSRVLLVVNFHQFRFGPACGGGGVPAGAVDQSDLSPSDPDCVLRAFEKFWRNENDVADRWIEFGTAFVGALDPVVAPHRDWLTLGIDLINEPFAGERDLFASNLLTTAVRAVRYFRDQQPAQINSRLVPFLERFLAELEALPGSDDLFTRTLLLFEPFALDHLVIKIEIKLPFVTLRETLKSDGNYRAMLNLAHAPRTGQPVYWVAAPHRYDGASDPVFLSYLPEVLRREINHYPNRLFNRGQTFARFALQQRRFREAGMDFILGELGTFTDLAGYAGWIDDSLDAAAAHTRGALWWQYIQDTSPQQNAYDLLRGFDDAGRPLPPERQLLKCSPRFDLVKLIFGPCPAGAPSAID